MDNVSFLFLFEQKADNYGLYNSLAPVSSFVKATIPCLR